MEKLTTWGVLRDGRLTLIGSALSAALVLCIVFPDVLFLKASLVAAQYGGPWSDINAVPVGIWPEPGGRNIYDGWIDLGGPAWQMDPYRLFLAHAIESLQSPYWNPYVGTGVIAPDNLVSQALSLPTVLSALLGGSDAVFMLWLMVLIYLSELCLMWIVSDYFRLSPLAALTAGFVFLLNGFVTSAPSTMVVIPYYFVPLVMLAMLRLIRAPGTGSAVLAVFAVAAMVSNTFIPTLTLSLTFCLATALSFACLQSGQLRVAVLRYWLPALAAVVVVAFLLEAFLYGAVLDTQLHATDMKQYLARDFRSGPWQAFVSLLSPKHFWQSYNAFGLPGPLAGLPSNAGVNLVIHVGIVAALLACHSYRQRGLGWLFAFLAAVVFWRLLNLPGAFAIFGHLPVYGIISPQYWSALLALAVCLGAAFGMDSLRPGRGLNAVASVVALAAVANVVFLAIKFQGGVPERNWIYVVIFLAILAVGIGLLLAISRWPGMVSGFKMMLLVLLVAEGVFYINHLRVERYETVNKLPPAIAWLVAHTHGAAGDRVFSTTRLGLYADWGSALSVPQIESMGGIGYEPIHSDFFSRYIGSDHNPFMVRGADFATAAPVNAGALDLLGVRYIVAEQGPYIPYLTTIAHQVYAEGKLAIFERETAMPRAFLVPALLPKDGIPQDFDVSPHAAATSTDAAFIAHASAMGVPIGGGVAASISPLGAVKMVHYNNGSLRLAVDAPVPGVLVTMDSWHRRWSAKVDGISVPLGVVNGAFRGVAIATGTHVVEMVYAPPVIIVSIGVSLITAVLLMAALLLRTRLDRRLFRHAAAGHDRIGRN